MADISKIKLPNGTTYDIKDIVARERGLPAGGNAGQVLSKIDGTDYNTEWIDPPSGGGDGNGYRIDLLYENTDFSVASGTGYVNLDYTLSASIDDYDAVIVSAFMVNKETTREQVETIIINKSQYYTRAVSSGTDDYNTRRAFTLNGNYLLGSQSILRSLYFGFADSTTLKTLSRRSNSGEEPKLYRVYGLKLSTTETAFIYSNEERVVGVWTDNKPLYQKTIDFGALPLSTKKTVAHNIANVDKIWVYDGFVYNSTGRMFSQLNRTTNSFTYQWETSVDRTNVIMQDYADFGNDCTAIITIQYTKTTDTPGSGPYITSGVYAHHYSTTEQVVGTWIDGSTLYEKTFTGTCPNRDAQISIQTLDEEILAKSISGYIEYTQGTNVFIPNYESSTWKAIFTISTVNGVSDLMLQVGSDFFNKPFYITLQYTKTS